MIAAAPGAPGAACPRRSAMHRPPTDLTVVPVPRRSAAPRFYLSEWFDE